MRRPPRRRPPPRLPDLDRTDLPLVTIDPPTLDGPRPGDAHRARRRRLRRATTRSPTWRRSSRPGDPIDLEANKRGETLYGADSKVPAAPAVDLRGRRPRCCPTRCARPCSGRSRSTTTGEGTDVTVERARVRSTAKLDYAGVQRAIDDGTRRRVAACCSRRSASCGWRARRPAAACRCRCPSRRSTSRATVAPGVPGADPGRAVERPDLAAHRHGRRVADGLRPGRAAAHPAAGGPPRRPAAAPHRPRARHRLAGRDALPRLHPRARPRQADARRDVTACTRLLRGSGYVGFDGEVPDQPEHSALASEYAHVTAPLRRLGDRYAGEICVALCAGDEVPGWVLDRLGELPETMQESDRRRPPLRGRRRRPGRGRRAARPRGGDLRGRRRRRRRQGRQARHHHGAGPGRRGARSPATGRCRSATRSPPPWPRPTSGLAR